MYRTLFAAMTLMVLGASASSAQAQASGVRCPNGYDTEYSNNVLRCSATKKVYVYPSGHDFGNASTPERGVKCPADGNDRQTFSGNVLKCVDVKKERRPAYCFPGWELKTLQGQDACRSVTGNMDPTLPSGLVSREGYTLHADDDGNKDAWVKATSTPEFPVAR